MINRKTLRQIIRVTTILLIKKNRPRVTTILPNPTRTITLPTPPTPLHQETTLITTAHLVLTAPQPGHIPWNILRSNSTSTYILNHILATSSLQTTYPLWVTRTSTQPSVPHITTRTNTGRQPRNSPPNTSTTTTPSIKIHLILSPLPSRPTIQKRKKDQDRREIRV